jgi:ubiquinone/menaquinone biosynthesis C-methylase UbiE
MNDQPIPRVNYSFAPIDGHNVFREKFGALSDDGWCELLVRSIKEPVIDGVSFANFPENELQNRIHGNSGATSITEAAKFFKFVKQHTYRNSNNAAGKRLLDFGSGWGRVIRPFMRDFEFSNLYGFEPNFLYCSLARTLNPYVTFLSGAFVPSGDIPEQFFNFMVGWSIFSHLSLNSATLWLTEAARVVVPGGMCVFTTWGNRFLRRLQKEAAERDAGKQIHWYSSVVLAAAGSIEKRILEYERGEFVWFTGGQSRLYGEAFVSESALKQLITQQSLPFAVVSFDSTSLGQDAFVLQRL